MELILGNSEEKLKELPDNSVDSIVCDPPYGLSFMGKKWDYDVPTTELWNEAFRVLKPGGHLLAFFGTRTYHRGAVRIEDAGFEIRDMVSWVYGSGFPKSLNVGRQINKLETEEWSKINIVKKNGTGRLTKGTSQYEGWGTALKPSNEPIVLARKPLSEKTVAENVLKWGTGGINIDGCRVASNDKQRIGNTDKSDSVGYGAKSWQKSGTTPEAGRFPANLIHSGEDEVVELFPNDSQRFFYCAKASKRERNKGLDSTVSIMIEYSICDINTTQKVNKVHLLVAMDKLTQKVTGVFGAESKNATEWNTVLFGNCTTEKYQEVNKSITETETNLITTSSTLNWLIHLLTNEYTLDVSCETENGGSPAVNAENCNTLTTTMNESLVSALGVKGVVSGTPLKINVNVGSNIHSTVKPIALMSYLCRLVTPKGGTVLDPFMGSGTTGIAAKQEGFDFIGIELDPEYYEIAKNRIQ